MTDLVEYIEQQELYDTIKAEIKQKIKENYVKKSELPNVIYTFEEVELSYLTGKEEAENNIVRRLQKLLDEIRYEVLVRKNAYPYEYIIKKIDELKEKFHI